ncbi:MAG: hypothetical protein JSU06_19690 [Actinobacteria bacterium]|nr:hypothetical protein [Actinomycetota bacterium]
MNVATITCQLPGACHRTEDAAIDAAITVSEEVGSAVFTVAEHACGWHVRVPEACFASGGRRGGNPIHPSKRVALSLPSTIVHTEAFHCRKCGGWHSARPRKADA